MNLLLISCAISMVGAIFSICTLKYESVSKTLGCLFGTVAACVAIISGITGIFQPAVAVSYVTPFSFANFSILLTRSQDCSWW